MTCHPIDSNRTVFTTPSSVDGTTSDAPQPLSGNSSINRNTRTSLRSSMQNLSLVSAMRYNYYSPISARCDSNRENQSFSVDYGSFGCPTETYLKLSAILDTALEIMKETVTEESEDSNGNMYILAPSDVVLSWKVNWFWSIVGLWKMDVTS
jgi:hypothetical protein